VPALTIQSVEKLKAVATRREIPDTTCPGLYLIVHATRRRDRDELRHVTARNERVGAKRFAGNVKRTDVCAEALWCFSGTFIVSGQRDLGVGIFKSFRMYELSVEHHRFGVVISRVLVASLTMRAVAIIVIPTGHLDDVKDVIFSRSAFAALSSYLDRHAVYPPLCL
jgi:hypothetical protein